LPSSETNCTQHWGTGGKKANTIDELKRVLYEVATQAEDAIFAFDDGYDAFFQKESADDRDEEEWTESESEPESALNYFQRFHEI
jgi:hypothetical protein